MTIHYDDDRRMRRLAAAPRRPGPAQMQAMRLKEATQAAILRVGARLQDLKAKTARAKPAPLLSALHANMLERMRDIIR